MIAAGRCGATIAGGSGSDRSLCHDESDQGVGFHQTIAVHPNHDNLADLGSDGLGAQGR